MERTGGTRAHLSEVSSVSLAGGLGGGDLVSSSGTGVSSKVDVGSGGSDLKVSSALWESLSEGKDLRASPCQSLS
jgi:hypothetical protein